MLKIENLFTIQGHASRNERSPPTIRPLATELTPHDVANALEALQQLYVRVRNLGLKGGTHVSEIETFLVFLIN